MSKYYEANREQKKEYREANKEHIAEYQKEYREANKEQQKQWYEANREHIVEQKKQYRNQLCQFNGETLTLSALRQRLRKAGIEHPTAEAKKYLMIQLVLV